MTKVLLLFCGVAVLTLGVIGLVFAIKYDKYVFSLWKVDNDEHMSRALLSIYGPWVFLPSGLVLIYLFFKYQEG